MNNLINCSGDVRGELPYKILTVREAASVLRICPAKCYELIRCNKIRSIRDGRTIRVPVSCLIGYIDSAVS